MEEKTKFLVTMKDNQRYKVLKDVIDKKLKGSQAAFILNLSYVHTSRLKQKVLKDGLQGILRPRHPAPNKLPQKTIKAVVFLRQEYYYDFNLMHLKDKLEENHNIKLSYESIRQILIKEGLYIPKKKKVVHRRRRRMPKAGMLIQMDSSQHQWLKTLKEPWWLTAMIDDANNEIPYAQFFPKDTLFSNMRVIRKDIEIKGIFMCLYVDKASHFKTTRHQGIHYNVNPEQDDTQIERALGELGINIIFANSPQAKGRIEIRFKLFQDRLINEMRLEGIKNYAQANKYLLEKFLPWYNQRYTIKNLESCYLPLPPDKNLNLIFCVKKERVVNFDNTIQFCGQIIQIPPSDVRLSFAKAVVDVCLLEDNRIFVLYKGKVVTESKLSPHNKIIKKEHQIEQFLNKREYQLVTV